MYPNPPKEVFMFEEFKVNVKPLTTLNITDEDALNGIAFFEHFKLETPSFLKEAVDNYAKAYKQFKKGGGDTEKPTLELLHLQNEVRVQLSRSFLEHPSPVFKHELFSVVVNNAKQVAFAAFFEKDLESELTKE
jgi:hypothetical protein